MHPSRTHVLALDLSNPTETAKIVQNFLDTNLHSIKKIDILVNNGGVSQRDSFEDIQLPMTERLMNINFTSVVGLCKVVLPGMIAQKSG